MNNIHIAIAFDQNYLPQFHALLASILTNNKGHNLEIHCIATGVSADQLETIKSIVAVRGGIVHFYEIDKDFAARFVLSNNWTMAVYYRLFFPFLVPEHVHRLLYIDTDTLVVNDLEKLYNEQIEDYPVGAVYDNYVKTQPLIGITEPEQYFNSGMLLINLRLWKAQKISEKAFDYLLQYPERIRFVDQCALNAVLQNNWKKLPIKYNLMTSYIPLHMNTGQKKEFIKDKTLLHFTLQRPWHYLCEHPYRSLYKKYLLKSPLKSTNPVIDFAWNKVPARLKTDAINYYMKSSILQKAWRLIKR
ncbi:glycosyltransferase family 8 protein [Chitinophagaceae bacterium MMS25-I14]